MTARPAPSTRVGPTPEVRADAPHEEEGGVLASNWIWAVVGVLAVSGASVGGYSLLRRATPTSRPSIE